MPRSRRRGSPPGLAALAALAGAVAVAVGLGTLLWAELGIIAVPIDIVIAVVLVRLLRRVFVPQGPPPSPAGGVRRDAGG